MDAFDKELDRLEDELRELREQLLVADANYENTATISERDAADVECKRLRTEIQARQQQLRTLFKDRSGPNASSTPPKKKAKAAGE